MDEDIRANGWGIKEITDAQNAEDFTTIFVDAISDLVVTFEY